MIILRKHSEQKQMRFKKTECMVQCYRYIVLNDRNLISSIRPEFGYNNYEMTVSYEATKIHSLLSSKKENFSSLLSYPIRISYSLR